MKDYFSTDFSRLLFDLLNRNQNNRITLDKVKMHPFFKKVNWQQVEDKLIKPFYKPKLPKTEYKISLLEYNEVKNDAKPSPANGAATTSFYDEQ